MNTSKRPNPGSAHPLLPALARATPAWRPARKPAGGSMAFLLRLDISWTLLYFVFLVCIAAITTSITQTQVTRALQESLHNLHDTSRAIIAAIVNQDTDRAYNMATGFFTVHAEEGFTMSTEKTLSALCTILDAYDKSNTFRSLAITSLVQKEAISCMHADPKLDSLSQLYGWITTNSVMNGTYLISPITYTFERPLTAIYGGWPSSNYNLSETFSSLYYDYPIFAAAVDYYNGLTDIFDYRALWRSFDAVPHILYCNVPAGILFRGMPIPSWMSLTDYVDVRVDASTILISPDYSSDNSDTAALFVNTTLSYNDPWIMSNNWGQASVNDSEMLTPAPGHNVSYLTVSNISNPLMRAALKHVDFKVLQKGEINQTVFFQFNGAPAVVTAVAFTPSRGMTLPLVFVSSHANLTLPYRRYMNIFNGVTAVVLLVITALFWWFIKNQLRDPLHRIAALLQSSAKTESRRVYHRANESRLELVEVRQLADAYNATMRQLREIDTFIPEAVRLEMRLRGRGLSTSVIHSNSQRSSSQRSSRRRPGRHLLTHLSTVLYLRIQPAVRPDQVQSMSAIRGGTETLPGRQRLAAIAANAARTVAQVNSGPFASPESLTAFATRVHELCEAHHGSLLRLSPDSVVIHFHYAVRMHLIANTVHVSHSASASASAADTFNDSRRVVVSNPAEIEHCAKTDAYDAAAFALELQRWVDECAAPLPDMHMLLDTALFTCGHYRALGSDQTVPVALGRDVQREVGHVPAKIGVRIAMTEETAQRVRVALPDHVAAIQQLPVEALHVGRRGLDADVIVLFELLPGSVTECEPWRRYTKCCFTAFGHMLTGHYAEALRCFKGVCEIAGLEPGLMPSSLRREAAPTGLTGGVRSTQVQRLMRECVRRVARGITTGFHRVRHVPLGIDAVLKGVLRRSEWRGGSGGDYAKRPRQSAEDRMVAEEKLAGKYGVGEHNPRFSGTDFRYVAVIAGTETRTCYAGRPRTIVDNWGTTWAVGKKMIGEGDREVYDCLYNGLSETGALSAIKCLLFREVPPLVSRLLARESTGPMRDEMRTAVPVWQPSSEQRRAVQTLMDARVRLRHPHVLSCLGYTMELEGGVLAVSEFCQGGNLSQVLTRYYKTKSSIICRFMLSITLGLRYLHANGIVHGHLCPAHVLVCSDGICRLKGFFSDYALAHKLFCLPKTSYVSPEVAAGQLPTAASDVFDMGLILLEVVTGEQPWAWRTEDISSSRTAHDTQTSEALTALVQAGGQALHDAVNQGFVTPAVERLEWPSVQAGHPAVGIAAIRSCLQRKASDRMSLNAFISVCEEIGAPFGISCSPLQEIQATSSSTETDSLAAREL